MDKNLLMQVNNLNLGAVNRAKYSLRTGISKMALIFHQLAIEQREILDAIKQLQDDLKHGRLERSGYVDHYSEQHEMDVWERYKSAFSTLTAQNSEVVFRGVHVRNTVLATIRQDSTIGNVVNFGCSYGWLERQIANAASNVKVWGVDRSEQAMQLNRDELGCANCSFVASDIFDFIDRYPAAVEGSIFCHINIGVYFLPAFITRLYQAVFSRGARYIVAFEPSGLSRETNDYYRYSLELQDPVVFRGPMLLNNYPHLMKEAGFDLIRADILRPPHPHADFRSVCFLSRRREGRHHVPADPMK